MVQSIPKPDWLRIKIPSGEPRSKVIKDVKTRALCTVCVEANCPNQMECFDRGSATFMLLGPTCTRNCTFCAVGKEAVIPPDPKEPQRMAQSVAQMKLTYCVLTMVTRDDLADGGADHICRTLDAIRDQVPGIFIEVLISDLKGSSKALEKVLAAGPQVVNHNIETVERLYPQVRPQAIYRRSLELLATAAKYRPALATKSGIMLGLGENRSEVLAVMDDLRSAGCQMLTIGQYLAPSKDHHPVIRYVTPDEFEAFKTEALARGFYAVASAPLVRSSYQADKLYAQSKAKAK
jgi:lipoyl synthase